MALGAIFFLKLGTLELETIQAHFAVEFLLFRTEQLNSYSSSISIPNNAFNNFMHDDE